MKRSQSVPRKPRTNAHRNRERILEVAKEEVGDPSIQAAFFTKLDRHQGKGIADTIVQLLHPYSSALIMAEITSNSSEEMYVDQQNSNRH